MSSSHPIVEVTDIIAYRLSDPAIAGWCAAGRTWWGHHLAHGALGIALLHAERAAAGLGPWQRVHDWLAPAARTPLTCGPDSHLNYGAPALAFVLAVIAERLPGAYRQTLDTLDATIAADIVRRADHARTRLEAGQSPVLADFDVVRGLTGIGPYMLRRMPDGQALAAVLSYLVQLSEPASRDGVLVPGWWTPTGPNGELDNRYPTGHANAGVAHGIGGPLALLALAARAGITVPGQLEAIATICAWLDHWRVDTSTGPVWPYWITRDEHRTGTPVPPQQPRRPSWCYGTAGLARAQQLAALALRDPDRQRLAEDALLRALTDPAQRATVTDPSLCHGTAGLAHIAVRVAADAAPHTARHLNAAAADLLDAVHRSGADPRHTATALLGPAGAGPGLLEGAAGVALAAQTGATETLPYTSWDACLLIS